MLGIGHSARDTYEMLHQKGVAMQAKPFAVGAVSYTHLDVYKRQVLAGQNNYCGLGTTGGGVKGAWFKSAQIGVRAHIQHIMAYATTKKPQATIVDPRYDVVKTTRNFGKAKTWSDLNGRWAIPGNGYGQKILKIHSDILATK